LKGFEGARSFIHTHFLSRQADLSSILKFSDPKRLLFRTLQKYSLGTAQLKLLKESGRQSHAAIFVVGAFDGNGRKLGEGMGSSIKMAEYRACEDALRRIYLQKREVKEEELKFPSDTLCSALDFQAYDEAFMGDDEVEWGSAGKSGKLANSWERQPWEERDRLVRA
jgi:large subunit ribosomal protein L44